MSSSRATDMPTQHYDTGVTQYKAGQWGEAVRSFDRAITLGYKLPGAWEYKAKSNLNLSNAEAAHFAKTQTGPDGEASYASAYKTAESAVKRFGKTDRWQPYYILADILYRRQKYSQAMSYLATIPRHPKFQKATPEQRAAVKKLSELVSNDMHFLRQRNKGREEASAVERDIELETRVKRGMRFDHLLAPDVFLRIVEVARDTDPRLATRMSGVCRRWRDVLVPQRGVWQRLILGKGSYVPLKVKTYLNRCESGEGEEITGLKELRITERFDINLADEVGRLVEPHAEFIQHLRIESSPGAIKIILRHFVRSMRSLRTLTIRVTGVETGNILLIDRLDLDLLTRTATSLEEVDLTGIEFNGPDYSHPEIPPRGNPTLWVRNPAKQLAHLALMRLTDSRIHSSTGNLLTLLQDTPAIKEVHLTNVVSYSSTVPSASGIAPAPVEEGEELRLKSLETWVAHSKHGRNVSRDLLPTSILAPNLLSLEYEVAGAGMSATEMLRSPAIREALPKLRSLSLGKTAIPGDFIDVLQEMTSLEFLNLAHGSVSAPFFEALASGATKEPRLLPNLIAISLAGNLELRAPVLRDFVNSRLPWCECIPLPAAKAVPAKRSMFAPSSSKSSSQSEGNVPPAPQSTPMPGAPPPARLRWLNIDQCESVDALLFPALRERLGFVSHWMGAPDEERIRGKGKWDWELDLSVECRMRRAEGGDGVEKCEVRATGNGTYRVHHVCAQAFVPEEQGWEHTSQIARSQLSASQARKGKRKAVDTGGQAGRRGRTSGLQEE